MKILLVLSLCTFGGCSNVPCIQPPPTSTQQQQDIIVKLKAAFLSIPVTPSIETDFKNVVNTAYAQLNDVNTAYFIGFQAAICFAKEGKWGQAVAVQILKDLEADWKARSGKTSLDAHPQATQMKTLSSTIADPPK
jgi:hypothetical protein